MHETDFILKLEDNGLYRECSGMLSLFHLKEWH